MAVEKIRPFRGAGKPITSRPIVLDVSAWVPTRQWAEAPKWLRDRFVSRCAELAKRAKLSELRRAIDVDGDRMPGRKRPRPDHADGPVLSPHRTESRTQKRLRAYSGHGHVTVTWTHGWLTILDYHARGVVLGAPRRDVIRGFAPATLARLKADCRRFWRGLFHLHGPGTSTPPRRPPAAPALPFVAPRRPVRRPAARPPQPRA